jgi:hypothetical protein
MNPSEGQWDGDSERDHAAPRHQEVAPEPARPATRDEALEWEVSDEMLHQFPKVGKGLAAKKELKRASKESPSRRALKPHDVSINDREGRKECAEKVGHQRRVEILQMARAHENSDNEQQCRQRGDPKRPKVECAEHSSQMLSVSDGAVFDLDQAIAKLLVSAFQESPGRLALPTYVEDVPLKSPRYCEFIEMLAHFFRTSGRRYPENQLVFRNKKS